MKKILCPTDFSDTAQNAIAYAAKLAQAMGSTLTLLNVQSTSPIGLQSGKGMVAEAVSARLEEMSNEIHQFFKISCDVLVVESGSVLSSAIVEKSADFDILVMGTNGAEDLFEFFTGSTTYHAIQKSKIPVLLIPSNATYSEIASIVYSYNYLGERKLPFAQLQPFIKGLKCDLTILQVTEEAVSQKVDEEMKELQFILADQLKNNEIEFHFDSIRSSEIAPSINSYIQRNGSDVLALCTIHRNFMAGLFHKSVIKIISEIASYPVFVFHE
jgi:nucleotide-binding universal stress UspA family protein